MLAGLIGVPLGSIIAQRLRLTVLNCDPIICAFSLLSSSLFVYAAVVTANISLIWSLIFVFIAQVTLNFTWSLVADMLLVRKT